MYKKEHTDTYSLKMIGMLTILSALILFGSLFIGTQRLYCSHMQEKLAQKVLRFHVIANSDKEQDQQLKLFVRDVIMDYFSKNMPQNKNIEETTKWVREHIDVIENLAMEALEEKGEKTSVHGAVISCYFSDRKIDGVLFPAGNYETLRLEIGQAKGHNWWCVLYPKFGFMDAVSTEDTITVQSKFKIKCYFWETLKKGR